jgi:hypothetical protein
MPYHAEPTTDSPMHSAMPKLANVYGEMVSRNCPTCRRLASARYALERVGAYVESFTLALEEHVCPSLATACGQPRGLHTQPNHCERGGRAAGSVRERHGEGRLLDAEMDGKVADWSSLVKAAPGEMTVCMRG